MGKSVYDEGIRTVTIEELAFGVSVYSNVGVQTDEFSAPGLLARTLRLVTNVCERLRVVGKGCVYVE